MSESPRDDTVDKPVAGTAPRGRGPYRKGVERRAQIVRAATQVFAELGYNGGSLRSISDRVGVSSASLVQYFGSKEGLLAAVLEQWAQDSRELEAADSRGLDRIRGISRVMRYNVEHRGLIELFLSLTAEATNPGHPARPFIQRRYTQIVSDLSTRLGEAMEDGEIAPMSAAQVEREARVFFAVMDGLELQWLIDPAVDLVTLFDDHLDATVARWRRP